MIPINNMLRTACSCASKAQRIHFARPSPQQSRRAITPQLLPSHVPLEEELIPGYQSKHFYPAKPGDVLAGRFELKAKLGFGATSTVWLAQNVQVRPGAQPYVAIKICRSNTGDQAATRHELEISKRIIDCALNDDTKYESLLIANDSLEVAGPCGSHLCLVMQPMREPLWLTRRRLCGDDKVTARALVVFKLYILDILAGLQYLHDDCNVVHTDLKLDNVMIGFEHESVVSRFADAQADTPMPRKVASDGRLIYLSHNNFGDLQKVGDEHPIFAMQVKLADFGLARRGDVKDKPLVFPIQVDQYHAPEVILGTGWSYSADIWNLGLMVWNLLAGEDLFQQISDEKGVYSGKHHLAEMISLMGPVPQKLIERERSMREWRWAPKILNPQGKLCENAMDFFGGPFLNDNGQFIGSEYVTSGRSLPNLVPECITAGQDRDDFVDFMRQVLCWLPEERKSAAQLQEHPWLTRWLSPPDKSKEI